MKTLGKYQILSQLGRGAMGIVYKAVDPVIERTVALKTIRKDNLEAAETKEILSRFKREAQAAGRLIHQNIVTIYEYGEAGPTAYIAMEYVQGRSLKEILDANERFTIDAVIAIMTQLLNALDYSHSQGVVHRDIKPGNIIVLADSTIKITDFGIARIESSNLTHFGDVMGTPSYMSPEQFMGQVVDNRSDIFSAGVILYHLLTGEKPFPGNSMTTIMHRVLKENPIAPSELNFQIPEAINSIIAKALAKKPADRFQKAGDYAAALTGLNLGTLGQAVIQPKTAPAQNRDSEATLLGLAEQELTIHPETETLMPGPTPGFSVNTLLQNNKIWLSFAAAAVVLLAALVAMTMFGKSPEDAAKQEIKTTLEKAGSTAPSPSVSEGADQKILEPQKKKIARESPARKTPAANATPSIKLTAKPQNDKPAATKARIISPSQNSRPLASPLLSPSTIPKTSGDAQKNSQAIIINKKSTKDEGNRIKIGGYGRKLDENEW